MDLSNNFVLAGLQNLELSKKIRPILKDYSEKIIKRIIEHDHNYKDYVCKDKNGIEILNNDNSNDEAN